MPKDAVSCEINEKLLNLTEMAKSCSFWRKLHFFNFVQALVDYYLVWGFYP